MAYEVKGRLVQNRPLNREHTKRLPVERPVYSGPLNPRLRPKEGFVQAAGFTAEIASPDED